jgi:hypothetical protein
MPLALLALSALMAVPLAAGGQSKIAMPDRHRKWLDEEVVYIITTHERDVFLHLQTDKERDIFIDAFWKQRDPSPRNPSRWPSSIPAGIRIVMRVFFGTRVVPLQSLHR